METCDRCNFTLTAAEAALGWPIQLLDGEQYVCPACYGPAAFCPDCGEVLPVTDDDDRCPECEAW